MLKGKERAIAGFVSLLAQAPWDVGQDDVAVLRAAGLGEQAILHVVVLGAYFNYLNRVADAVDIEFDYESALPRMVRDVEREPLPIPAPRVPNPAPLAMRLVERAGTAQAFAQWSAYVMERDQPLTRRDRRVIARSASLALADGATAQRLADAVPRDDRECILGEYARVLTSTPWRLGRGHLDSLRALGLDDVGLLDVISVAAFQNTASRLGLVLTRP